jgi:hypothetical protein
MQITDQVHWRYVYERNGTLRTESMRRKRTGKWKIENDELCLELEPPDGGCFEVWLSGPRIELRPSGAGITLEGVIEPPTGQN